MRAIVLAALLLAACQLHEPVTAGTVVSVEEAPRAEAPEIDPKYYDHPLVPEVGWRLEVRLDDGNVVTVMHHGERRYAPGERVRLLLNQETPLLL